ncbi:putative OsmC-like protein [Caldalkalibacillus uzonensis]|uniref:OsmC-like protein n=1 Tax=Caldalkalibacillus uzonensis TaxID=353224 RepID=A0ABU0CXX2_9BACI|nr:OsmC family protein [Caldalkalibacillus uzonensis]MDQ0340997.1 putative OsmC-like protein [Caldalkalibacillus uzonensis]
MSKMKFKVNGQSAGLSVEMKAGKHTVTIDEGSQLGGQDRGPNPLQTLLCALAGCENVTAHVIAKQMNFDLQGITFEITGEFDPRGFMGDPNVRTYFEKVYVTARVHTTESEERIKELQKMVEQRCPVYGTFKTAGIEMHDNWIKA